MYIKRELKEKLLKLVEEQAAYIQELRQRLYLSEKVCYEAEGYLKFEGGPLGSLYLEYLEDAVKKWDSYRQNNGAKYVVVEREVTNDVEGKQ